MKTTIEIGIEMGKFIAIWGGKFTMFFVGMMLSAQMIAYMYEMLRLM